MGCRRARNSYQKKRRSGIALDDAGQLSIDFLAGISIFVLALIIASTMISSLLIGLQSKRIDYDAVAYRTGVILVEDPGEPNTQFNYLTINEANQWEFIGYDQKDKVRRFGLTLYKSTPHILAEQKINSFYNPDLYSSLSEYHERMIAGNYPYNFNVSLKIIGGKTYYIGDILDPNSTYGYIRRVVLVKTSTNADVDMRDYFWDPPTSDRFFVNFPYFFLYNQSRGPEYWIEPPKEKITVNLTNIIDIKNQSQPNDVTLNNITLTFDYMLLNGTIVPNNPLPVDIIAEIDGPPPKTFSFDNEGSAGGPQGVSESINITFPAGYFIPPSTFANITLIKTSIRYGFSAGTVNLSSSFNSYDYLPGKPGFSPPHLLPAILEVRVW